MALVLCLALVQPAPSEYLIGYHKVGGTSGEVAHVIGFIGPDDTGERYPDFAQPNQRSWVFGPQFADSRRLVLSSYEKSI